MIYQSGCHKLRVPGHPVGVGGWSGKSKLKRAVDRLGEWYAGQRVTHLSACQGPQWEFVVV